MGDDGFHHAMFFDAGDEVGSQGGILAGDCGISGVSARQEISNKAWAVMAPLFPVWKRNGRPIIDMRRTVEGIVWRFRTGAPWRDVPERFGNWNSVYGRFADLSRDGTWASVLAAVQAAGQHAVDVDWTVSVDATITRVHQHGATLPRTTGAPLNYRKLGDEEPCDHAIGKSRGGMTCKIHLATDGKGRPLGLVLTAGQAADTSFFQTVLETISVAGSSRGGATHAARPGAGRQGVHLQRQPRPSCWPGNQSHDT